MKTPRSPTFTGAIVLLVAWIQVVTAFAVTYTNVFFNAAQTRTVLASSINSVTIRSGDYTFTYSVDGYWSPVQGGQPTGRFFSVNWPTGVQAQAITAGPLLGKGANITLKRADGKKFDLKAFTGKILLNTAGAGAAFEIMPLVDGEDAFNDPLMYDCTGYGGASFSYTPSLVNYDTYKIHMWGDFALTALTLIDTNPPLPPLTFNITASVSSPGVGTAAGAGTFDSGTSCTLTATANPGHFFVNWTEAGVEKSTLPDYTFTVGADRVLVANFAVLPVMEVTPPATPAGDFQFTWPSSLDWLLEESGDLLDWTPSTQIITTSGGRNQISIPSSSGGLFFRLVKP
ncbi:MAG: hypothetical protein IAE77_26275 [Prosthecobacter sp.]|jgi:hypothetical protein|uniref:InlB B-repeat-containing protein n=1 Tax=Prosthecobacter sp. TaxID=1965333 RepID=UPI0019DC11A3|nr:hypothetical protein [Prosthecobacter sp.]MBE2286990.1 hypothetical protein [Prosthecobacter sp.]